MGGLIAALAFATVATAPAQAHHPQASYEDLVDLFSNFRAFQNDDRDDGVPDYSLPAMAARFDQLREFQERLRAIDSSDWPVSEQVDYHLVRAEMNGMEFQHRVLIPWAQDPGFYNDAMPRVRRMGDYPLNATRQAQLEARLAAVSELLDQAKINLADFSKIAGDLGTLAVLSLGDTRNSYVELAVRLGQYHPELVDDVEEALAAIDDYVGWIETNKHRMTARAGVGKDNYTWLMKNVYLFPYSWEEIRMIVELEDNRVRTFQQLEANRNRDIPPIEPVQSQAEYRASVADAIDHLMNFVREKEIFTIDESLTTDDYFGSWHGFDNPWPEKHDYFFNFSHREPLMEETHEMIGHHFDGIRSRNDDRAIRGGRRPYKIGTARGEGFAFALEELLMHAGYLDGRNPHGREIAYEQAAFRSVRALSDIYMHSGEWSYDDAYAFCVANAPHGELLDGSHHLWFELDTTLRGVGHHMLMVVGKVQFMKLFRDRAAQLGDDFDLKEFMDGVLGSGAIPWSLIRWEMTGLDDEIRELTSGPYPHPEPEQNMGSKIAFVSNRDGNAEIYVMDADGSNMRRLTHNPGYDGAPTWSPDGTRIAFASSRDGNADIYLMNADGSNVTRLTTDAANDGGPSWSPDGSMIAFDSNRSGSSQVWRMNVDAGNWGYNLTQLTADHPQGRVNNFLALSPDGRWIAFEADRDRDDPEIYLASAVDGTNQQRLTFTRALDEVPSWTPDSRQIVYSTDRDGEPQNGNYEIYIMNVDGSHKRRLTDAPGADSNPSVSGDGTRIVFDSERDGATEIYVMNLDGTNQVRLTRSGSGGAGDERGVSNSNPAWSPH